MNKIKVSGNLWRYSVSAFYFNRVFLLVMLIVLSFLVRQMTFLVHFYLAVKLSQPKVLNLACVLQLNRIYSAFAWLGPPVQYMISYLCFALQRYLFYLPFFFFPFHFYELMQFIKSKNEVATCNIRNHFTVSSSAS